MDVAGELAAKLRSMREAAPRGRKIAAVHLFGTIYAQELEGMDLQAIAARGLQTRFEGRDPKRRCFGGVRRARLILQHRLAARIRRKEDNMK